MSNREYHHIKFSFEILSNIGDVSGWDFLHVLQEAFSGDLVGSNFEAEAHKISAKEMATKLSEFGSQPEFFSLDDNGVHEDDLDE